jgi:hypothetical protein
MDELKSLDQYIEAIPEPRQIKERLSENLREAKLLRRLLKLAEDRQARNLARSEGSHAD